MVVQLVQAALAAAASSAAGAAAAGEGQAAGGNPAEALALELVGDDRLLEAVCDEAPLRRQLLGLLWNHAVQALTGRQASETALAFFTAAVPLLDGGGGGGSGATQMNAEGGGSQAVGPRAMECRRAQALCCLGIGQSDRCRTQWLHNCLLGPASPGPNLQKPLISSPLPCRIACCPHPAGPSSFWQLQRSCSRAACPPPC
jgi:hypothetical protein